MSEFELKIQAVKEIESNLNTLIKKSKDILDRIDKEGINSNFSINSDILYIAQKIHSYSALLGYMKNFKLKLANETKSKKRKSKK